MRGQYQGEAAGTASVLQMSVMHRCGGLFTQGFAHEPVLGLFLCSGVEFLVVRARLGADFVLGEQLGGVPYRSIVYLVNRVTSPYSTLSSQ